MNFFKSLLPATVPPKFVGKPTKDIALERILQRILLGATFFFSLMTLLFLFGVIQNEGFADDIMVGSITFVLIILTVFRGLPYKIRAIFVVNVILAIGIAMFFLNGVSGVGISFLLIFTLITGVLLGKRSQIASIVVMMLAFLGVAHAMSYGLLPDTFPVFELSSDSIRSWRFAFSLLVIVTITSSVAVSSLFDVLKNEISKTETLTNELQNERKSLAVRVKERTADLQKRSAQIRAIANISRNINSILDQEIMFQEVVNQLKDRMDLYYAGIFIIEETRQFAILKAGTGEAGQQMVANNHRLEIGGTSMIGWCVSNRLPRIALDVGEEAVRFNNPYLPETRSELALPIISQNETIGAITIQSTQSNAFDEDDILIFEGIADSLSVAFENARLFQQNQADLNEIRFLSRQYVQDSWSSYLQASDTLSSEFENPLISKTTEKTYSHNIPVNFRDEEIGKIVLETTEEQLSPDDQQFIEAVSAQAVMALETARLLQETRRQALQEEKINQISSQFTNALDVRDVLETALKEISQLPAITEIAVHLVPPESQTNNNGNEVHK